MELGVSCLCLKFSFPCMDPAKKETKWEWNVDEKQVSLQLIIFLTVNIFDTHIDNSFFFNFSFHCKRLEQFQERLRESFNITTERYPQKIYLGLTPVYLLKQSRICHIGPSASFVFFLWNWLSSPLSKMKRKVERKKTLPAKRQNTLALIFSCELHDDVS